MAKVEILDDKWLQFDTLAPEVITRTMPQSKIVSRQGIDSTVVVPWEYDNMQALAYMGLPYISTIARDFDFSGPYEPKAHQLIICNVATVHNRGYCFADMGLGKTASFIWSASYLAQLGLVKKILVVCPKVVMRAAWMHELAMLAPFDSVAILDGSADKRRKQVEKNAKWDVINYEGVEVLHAELLAKRYDLVIVDESTMIKNPASARWKFLNEVTSKVPRLWLLSASPTPQGPMDAFGQLKLVSPTTIPREYYAFRNAVMQVGRPAYETRAGAEVPAQWVAKPDSNEVLKLFFTPAIRLDKADWVKELPPICDMYLEVPLSTEQDKALKALHKQVLKAQITDETIAGGIISKVYQISSGCMYKEDESGERETIRYDMQPKVDAVKEIIEEAKARHDGDFVGGKTLIYVSHRHVCEYLTEELSKTYKVGKVIGGSTNRSDILHAFETSDEYEVIVAVSSAMSHGVTAIAANTIIWFTPATSTEVFIQAGERTHRIGQRQEGRRYYLFSTGAERERHEHLQTGTVAQNEMLSLYKTFLEE